jgi:plasmid stabilization system protein ParE
MSSKGLRCSATLAPASLIPFRVVVTRRAAAEIGDLASWWRLNRPKAPGAVREEIERAFSLLSLQPNIGARARSERLGGVRRILLSRIRYHLYYRVDEGSHQVEVLALWHANRGRGPGVAGAG